MGWHWARLFWNLIFPHLIAQLQAQDVKQADRARGSLGNFIFPEAPSFHPIYTLRDLGQFFTIFSPETLMSHLEDRRKGKTLQRWWPKRPWDHAKPQQRGSVFPLHSLEWRVDFSSFHLTPTSPPRSRLLAVPALISRENSQNRLLLLWQ